MRHLAAVSCLIVLGACQRDAGNRAPLESTQAPLVAPGSSPGTSPLPATPALEPTAEVLDQRDGRVLIGVPVPPPPDSDAMLRYHVRTEQNGARVDQPQGLDLVDNALLLPGEAWLAVLPSTDLVVVTSAGQRLIDTEVARSLDVTADGRDVVYMRGHMPFFEIHEANVLTGETIALTDGFAPAWLPAYSQDATRIVFTSARSGVPALYSMARDGSDVRQHTNSDVTIVSGQPSRELTPSPTGPRAPIWGGGLFVFESDAGVVALHEDGRIAWTRDGASSPRWLVRGQSVLLATRAAPGVLRPFSLATGEPLEAP